MPKCTFLIGVPGSGKSTWLAAQGDIERTMVISTDDTIQRIADEYEMTYNEAFPDLIKFAEKVMWKSLEDSAYFGDDIIIDRTNLSVGSRKRFIKFLQGYEFEAVVFLTPESEEWNRRLNSRTNKTIPINVLQSMAKNFDEPSEAEGFSKITYINP